MAKSATWLLLLTTLLFGFLWLRESRLRRHEADEARRLRDSLGQDLVKVIRNQRHGFINHLQVISGWLQLKKPDHVLEYIDGIRRRREQESQVLRVRSLEVLGLLLSKSSLAEANEVDVHWAVEGALAEPPGLWIDALGLALEALISDLARSDAPRPLTIHLSESEREYIAELVAETDYLSRIARLDPAGLERMAALVRSAGGRWDEQLLPNYQLQLAVPLKSASVRYTRAG